MGREMARFTNGWIKLHKSLLTSDLSQNHNLFGIWIWILLSANYLSSKVLFCGEQRVMEPGDLICGMAEISERFGISRATAHKWLHYLKDSERIALEVRTRGCFVRVLNWKQYQSFDEFDSAQGERKVNAERTQGERGVALNIEVKNKEVCMQKENEPLGDKITLHPILEVWNKACSPLAKVREMTDKRKPLCKRAWEKNSDLAIWERQIMDYAANKHNQGKNDSEWQGNFDHFIKPDIQTRIVEGYYSRHRTKVIDLSDIKDKFERDNVS
jgi:hypothetical protein